MESKPTILVVDDEPAIRLGLAATISRYGFNVVIAEDGRDALVKAREVLPDLILSDVMMPAQNGFEMRREMSTDPQLASIPFIFLTARGAVEDRVTGIRDGADDYITKPFVSEELIARIEAVLRRVKTEQDRGREQGLATAKGEVEKFRNEVMHNFRHELRTPLGNVIMSLEMAVSHKYESPEEQAQFIHVALSNADRLESLVSDMILLSNIDQDDLNRVRQPIDVAVHIIGPMQKRLQRYEEKHLAFVHDTSLTGTIMAPRRELSHALVHLADNAFKFSPEKGRVELTVRSSENGGVNIILQDEGPGIPADMHERVFEHFFQASQGTDRGYQGLGVGLPIARAVFSSLGGDVRIVAGVTGCRLEAVLPDLRPEDISFA
jgi:two-component system sensor histidine kinase/response regulator